MTQETSTVGRHPDHARRRHVAMLRDTGLSFAAIGRRLGNRNKAREHFWRYTIAAWQESGQSIRAFCADRGAPDSAFSAAGRG
jgi:hypothetical protein